MELSNIQRQIENNEITRRYLPEGYILKVKMEYPQASIHNTQITPCTQSERKNLTPVERAKAKNDFEKDFYKLMNNSVFGKTYGKSQETLRYGEKIQLCYTDTDSLLVQIQTEDINADLIDMADQFDFSDYPKDHPVREALGDETTNPKHGIRKAKGVPSKVVKKEFHHERYNKALFDPKHNDTVTFRAIRSDRHAINVIEMSKGGLSPMDDKNGLHKIISQCMHMETIGYHNLKINIIYE
ncbi:unnamed protein product [Rhizophagus irregularis]|nr:unnamed protein product [Rhizophagus irregularis]